MFYQSKGSGAAAVLGPLDCSEAAFPFPFPAGRRTLNVLGLFLASKPYKTL